MSALPLGLLFDGEPFEDIDGFLYDNEDALSLEDKQAIEDVAHGKRSSAYIGGGHLPVIFICAAEEETA